ncbi:hypothetical protein ACTA71_002361 [Dictyostelium dimigraforme]
MSTNKSAPCEKKKRRTLLGVSISTLNPPVTNKLIDESSTDKPRANNSPSITTEKDSKIIGSIFSTKPTTERLFSNQQQRLSHPLPSFGVNLAVASTKEATKLPPEGFTVTNGVYYGGNRIVILEDPVVLNTLSERSHPTTAKQIP